MGQRPTWRLLRDGTTRPAAHFAVEEAIVRGVGEGSSPDTLRLRDCAPSVWIGLNQSAAQEVDLDFCGERGIGVVRRHNPGGAVYQDGGSAVFSITFEKDATFRRLGLRDEQALYGLVGAAVVDALASLGVSAEASGRNDVTVGGRKVYGSAQLEMYGAFCHSGSLLASTDVDTMSRALSPPASKFQGKPCSDVRGRVATLSELLGRTVSRDEAFDALARSLGAALGVGLVPGALTEAEAAAARELEAAKYGRREWTFPDEPRWTASREERLPEGTVRVSLLAEGGRILRMKAEGDFLMHDQATLAGYLARAEGMTLDQAAALAGGSGLGAGMRETIIRLLDDARRSAGRG